MAARRYGRRIRRGVAGTAVAAAAMAALGASQAPGLIQVAHAASQDHGGQDQQAQDPASTGPAIDGDSPYVTQVPPLNSPAGPLAPTTGGGGATVTVPGSGASLPTTVLAAYQRAQDTIAQSDPGCHLPWELLAAIGQVESGQARGGAVDANGTTYQPILGPVLNGNGFADITDTDGGKYDGDPVHDRAVGPMQFIPSTWATWGVDGNGDGVADPNNIYDAALAAGHYLCADGRDLAVPAEMDKAILGYNHSQAYLNLVRAWYDHFRKGGAVSVPDKPGHGAGVTIPLPPAGSTPSSSPTKGGTPTGTPKPTKTSGGSITTPTPTTSPTGTPTTSPTGGGGTTTPPPTSGDPTTTPPTSPTSGDPTTTPPTGDPTDPGCPTATQTPTDGGTVSPSPTDTATATGDPTTTPDPCGTDTPTPDPSDTAGAVTGGAL
ncbi:lytic transglycosylase domain-containing protein [Actinacidiphila guanduensis]|uniref:Membrane-bound lytic murein transglycosylase B n=1 Tax=Actinacidiphila guanduensis TaxID=310781 RepID=A0A1H0DVL5_9ACTN|nr:lytic transglycosylase domain-containing protein [Actinacidiphila guanduensis]SDN74165.1 Membrane-bound lytic murein transglycosylase B [Actinacidiphila guanduensis]